MRAKLGRALQVAGLIGVGIVLVLNLYPEGITMATMHAGQRRFRQVDLELRTLTVKRLHQNGLEALAQFRVVMFARRINEAGEEPAEGIAAHEQAGALPLAQAQNAHRHLVEFVRLDLEKLIARVLLQNGQQGLG